MEDDTGGDPVKGCKWTHKTTAKVAEALKPAGIRVSANTVARLLKQMDYSLRVNLKSLESGLSKPPDPAERDAQFRYILKQSRSYAAEGMPVISVDTKSRELIGAFHQAGRRWSRKPLEVFDHDFPSDADGVAIPCGIYDPSRNQGFVLVGTTRDTSRFAVDAINAWWTAIGRRHYPRADRLLILADGGGSNGYRTRLWKHQLQIAFCDRFGISVHVSHYPPGSSKWNPIEHQGLPQGHPDIRSADATDQSPSPHRATQMELLDLTVMKCESIYARALSARPGSWIGVHPSCGPRPCPG